MFMIVTIASGKGGTGKTTVAVSLALSLAADGRGRPLLLDCDVEEPNAALFLRPDLHERREVGLMIPAVDLEACTFCGRCAEVCQYHAIVVVGEKVLVFPELCHGCGSCMLNCPTGAIHEVLHVIGTIERGQADGIEFAHGTMNVGEPMAVPIIRQLMRWMIPPGAGAQRSAAAPGSAGDRPIILDASPGTACLVVETMRGADVVLMVTEPTPFGLHDLRLAVEVARVELGLPVGVVVNRDGVGDQGVDDYCAAEDIPILMRIPLERRIAEGYSEGVPLVEGGAPISSAVHRALGVPREAAIERRRILCVRQRSTWGMRGSPKRSPASSYCRTACG
jgi:MinD superfamily P-loop ATPase